MTLTAPRRTSVGAVATAIIGIFAAVVIFQLWGVVQDTLIVLRYRFGLDYGEGIVWQQVLLMFSPKMYSPSPDLPFIVFHYPPFYHFIVRGLLMLEWDPLFAGRLLSVVAAAISALSIGWLILAGIRQNPAAKQIVLAVMIALMFLCLPVVRAWGVYMRVDMLAEALGLLGTAVFVVCRCSKAGLIVALLLCVASLFTKQTQLPAGISVFLVALVCAPRKALVAACVAGGVGLACVAALEVTTGGFLRNIISYNINPLTTSETTSGRWIEHGATPFFIVLIAATAGITSYYWRNNIFSRLRECDRQAITEVVIVLHFLLASFSALQILKDGGSNNYFIDFLATGCVLIGIALCRNVRNPPFLIPAAAILTMFAASLHHSSQVFDGLEQSVLESELLVERIASAELPVSSDDMVLIMRAGKSIVFEPAIARVLVAGGKWDPAPLLAMIRNHGFAFALMFTDGSESGPLITQAIDEAYPRREVFRRNITAFYPP